MAGSVLDLFAKLVLDSSEYEKGLDNAKGKGDGFLRFLSGVGKTGVAAFTALGTATVAIGAQAVDAYKNYEQLAGGVQKLYGDAAQSVMKFAENAYMTSGMAMNDYMSQATALSAALINSLGGDQQKAAEQTDVAMRAISDNYNTFGGDIENVAGVFQALSKQQYQTLDNLKLGYAGTKTGMEQLIKDANEWAEANGKAADLSIDSFSDVVTAIDYIQQKQGIAGTTAKEAMKTIEGSANATKAAWKNVITSIGKGEGISDALSGLSKALFGENEGEGFVSQLSKGIKQAMEGIGDFVVEAAPMIVEKLPEVLSAIVPSVLETVVSLFTMLGQFMYEQIPVLFNAGISALNGFLDGLQEKIPDIISWAIELIGNIASWIIQNLPTMINTGMKIVGTLIQGLVAELPHIVSTAWDLAKQAFDAFFKVDWFSLGRDIITGIIKGLERYGDQIREALKNIAKNAFQGIKNFFGIESPSKLMRDEIGKYIPLGIVEGIKDTEKSVFDAMAEIPDIASEGFANGKMPVSNSFEENKSSNDFGTIIALLQQIANNGINVVLEGDANQIFKVVRKQSANFERAKGYSAI